MGKTIVTGVKVHGGYFSCFQNGDIFLSLAIIGGRVSII